MGQEEIVISTENGNFPFIDTSYPLGLNPDGSQRDDGSNLLNLLNTVTPSTATITSYYTTVPQINPYLASLNNTTNRLPTSWDAFAAQSPNGAATENFFLQTYREILGMSSNISIPADGDFAPLGISAADVRQQFKNSFSDFLANYPFENTNKSIANVGEFLGKWARFMTQTAVISNASLGTTGLASFEQIYQAFELPNSTGDFETKLRAFYDKIIEETGGTVNGVDRGYFIPSFAIDEWMESVRDEYLNSFFLSSVGSPSTDKVLVIDRILRLLILMIDVLQKVSVTQAQRLTFLTNWQQAYTELLTDIPTFTIGDGSVIDGNLDNFGSYNNTRYYQDRLLEDDAAKILNLQHIREQGEGRRDSWLDQSGNGNESEAKKNEAKMRDKINPKMQALQEKVRARRSQVSDWSKAMQSTINQSQDSANQQTDLATALLQQLSTILASIFR